MANLSDINISFNNNQLKLMKGTIHDNDNFVWEDANVFNILKSEIPKLGLSGYEINDDLYKKSIKELAQLIESFNNRDINYKDYKDKEYSILINLTKVLNNKEINKPHIYLEKYYDYSTIDDILKFSRRLFIKGDGGIGKSFLLYKFVEELKKHDNKYVISFGKFNKFFDTIDLKNILELSKEEPVYFIIDAYNEYNKNGRNKIINFISNNIDNTNIKFIVSYRNYSLEESELIKITNLFDESYELYGVDMEDALSNLINDYGIDVTKYEEIINLQNPLYIKLLKKSLNDQKIVEELLNSESQVTFIYEQFIKSIDKKIWEYTKNIVSKYMYDNEIKRIEDSVLKQLLNMDFTIYIDSLQQNGLLSSYIDNGKKYYYFTIDTMNDFIIARSFFDDIDNLNDSQIVSIINKKLKKLYSLYNAFIICLFDKFNNNILRALKIIKKSKLKYYFNAQNLRMIKFEEKSIQKFQENVNLNLEDAINNLAGYPNKPYNFCNYFNKHFLENDVYLNLMYNSKYNYINNNHLKKKAKIIASLIKRENYNSSINKSKIFQEYFWFSFWFMGTSNEGLRNLSKKNVYEICTKCNDFYEEMVNLYPKLKDEYIKNGIIEIICTSSKNVIKKYSDFLKKIYYCDKELDSLRIIRIDNSIFDGRREYIKAKKYNLLKIIKNEKIDDKVINILFKVDIYDKYLLPWRYWGKDHIDCNLKFIKNSKSKLTKINELLTNKYPCLLNEVAYCNFNKEDLLNDNNFKINEKKIEEKKYLQLFQKIIYKVSKKYNFNLAEDFENIRPEFFKDTLACKIVEVSRHVLEGTLMCNYYTNEFCLNKNTFENKIGYGIYNPYEYEESFDLNFSHPYSLFNQLADKLDEKTEAKINQTIEKEKGWEDDVENIKKNLFKFISPITIKQKKWFLLSASLRYILKNENGFEWMDTYLINCTFDSKKELTGINDRYITIEQNKYNEAIQDYINCDIDECSIMNSIKYNSNDFPENSIVLPPANLIKKFNLRYRPVDSSWIDEKDNIIIISNNNTKRYYDDVVTNSVYLCEEYFNKIKNYINYFSFTSRSRGKGYSEKSEFHMQFNNVAGEIKSINNNEQKSNDFKRCDKCSFNKIQTEEELEKLQKELDNLLNKL